MAATVARRAGLRAEALADVDDEPRSRWDAVFAAIGRASPPTAASDEAEGLDRQDRKLHAEVEQLLAEVSRSGGVILGRGGAVVLASVPGALHVYLGGDRDRRIERVMHLQGLDREPATDRVEAHDEARRDYVRNVYGIEGDDPELYHLMIDAISLGVDVCVDLIVAASESRTRQSVPVGAG